MSSPYLLPADWKVKLSAEGTQPLAVKVRLYDLLFKGDEASPTPRYNGAGADYTGFNLPHDIFLHLADLYLDTGEVNTTTIEMSNWLRYGMDIAPVKYDPRARPVFVEDAGFNSILFEGVKKTGWIKYDPDSALYPLSLSYFHDINLDNDPRPWYAAPASGSSWSIRPLLSIGIVGDTSQSAVLMVGDADTVFQATLETKTGYSAFTTAALNFQNERTWKIVEYLTGKRNEYDWSDSTGPSNIQSLLGYNNIAALKATYVWLRCSWYADYVNSDDFDQDLDPKAQVQHRNLYISAGGDFNRYDEFTGSVLKAASDAASVDATRSESSQAYIPVTTPAVDLLSPRILSGYDKATVEDAADAAITNSDDYDTTVLGSLQTAAISRKSAKQLQDNDLSAPIEHMTPPGWFDPEARKKASDYTEKPVLVPKDGNILTDGRIMSPTIDELWVYLKRLVSGRGNDIDARNDVTLIDEGSLTVVSSAKVLDKDVLPFDSLKFAFTYKADTGPVAKVGDPLDFEIASQNNDINDLVLRVTSFINAPEAIKYTLFEAFRRLDHSIVGSETARSIENFLPWNSIDWTDNVTVAQKDLVVAGMWAPRPNPYSLRELEWLLKEIKYNVVALSRYLKENFAVTGGLGRKANSNDPIEKAAGALYQLHKDYNFDVDNPNTVFDKSKKTPEAAAVLTDGTVYGSSNELPESSRGYSSADVYLAADGTWRYLFDHVRVPVISETEEPY